MRKIKTWYFVSQEIIEEGCSHVRKKKEKRWKILILLGPTVKFDMDYKTYFNFYKIGINDKTWNKNPVLIKNFK